MCIRRFSLTPREKCGDQSRDGGVGWTGGGAGGGGAVGGGGGGGRGRGVSITTRERVGCRAPLKVCGRRREWCVVGRRRDGPGAGRVGRLGGPLGS